MRIRLSNREMLRVSGSITSAVSRALPSAANPPAIRTFPFFRRAAAWSHARNLQVGDVHDLRRGRNREERDRHDRGQGCKQGGFAGKLRRGSRESAGQSADCCGDIHFRKRPRAITFFVLVRGGTKAHVEREVPHNELQRGKTEITGGKRGCPSGARPSAHH